MVKVANSYEQTFVSFPRHIRFDQKNGHANQEASESFGSTLGALGRPKEIRNPGNLRCKLLLSRFSLMNYTNATKYEAPEKNAVCA
jgi:hypothetical protein